MVILVCLFGWLVVCWCCLRSVIAFCDLCFVCLCEFDAFRVCEHLKGKSNIESKESTVNVNENVNVNVNEKEHEKCLWKNRVMLMREVQMQIVKTRSKKQEAKREEARRTTTENARCFATLLHFRFGWHVCCQFRSAFAISVCDFDFVSGRVDTLLSVLRPFGGRMAVSRRRI